MKVTKKNIGTVLLFILPGLAIYVFFVLYPIGQSLVFSTFKWDTLTSKHFTGLSNFKGVFSDVIFRKSLKSSLIFMLGTTAIQVFLGFALGYILYLQPKGYRIFKTILFMPTVLSSIAVGFIWRYIYSPGMGLLKPFMQFLGLGKYYVSPLADSRYALLAIMFAQVWCSLGTQMIMFNAGFMDMPEEVLESAAIDGASGFKMIRHMVIPMSKGTIRTVIILQLISALRSFDLIYTMTNGGPNHSTEVLPAYLFPTSFRTLNFGYGSVVSVVIFVICMTMTLFLRTTMFRKKED